MSKKNDNQKIHIEANDALTALQKNPRVVGKGCLVICVFGLLFFSCFATIGLYFFSHFENAFIERAIKTKAFVTSTRQQRQVSESMRSDQSYSNKRYTVKYITIVDIRFKNKNGDVIETRLSDGENSLLRTGDSIDVLYDPENPKNVRFFTDKDNASKMRFLSYIFGSISIVLAIFATLLIQKRRVR